jgi:plasmid stabilization system protein ParE
MLNLIYSARASNDLDDIRSYIADDNEYYADKVVETIFAFANNLATFPMMGKEISTT